MLQPELFAVAGNALKSNKSSKGEQKNKKEAQLNQKWYKIYKRIQSNAD